MSDDHSELLNQLKIDREDPTGMPRRSLWGLWGGGLGLFFIGLAGWWAMRAPAAITVTTFTVQAPREQRDASVLDASGYVTARRRATVSSKITGKVKQVLVEEGMRVAAGQVVAYLDDSSEQVRMRLAAARMDAARSKVAEIQAQLHESGLNLDRIRRMAARTLASQAELDSALASRDSLKARVAAAHSDIRVAQRNLDVLKDQLEQTVIRAPFAGVVVAKNAQPGEMISPTSAGGGFTRTGICTVVDMQSLEIDVDVNEAYIQRVKPGQAVSAVLDAYPDWKIEAHVIAIIPTADRQRATVKVRIGFAQRDRRILPDMGVKVSFLDAEAKTASPAPPASRVSVPSSAVHETESGHFVWLLEGGRVRRQGVEIIAVDGDRTRIATGLSAGQRVVVHSNLALSDGAVAQTKPTES